MNLIMISNLYYKKIRFCLICIILLFGVSAWIITPEYVTIPRRDHNPYWFAGEDVFKARINYNPYFWEFSIGNKRLSNLENMIVFLFMLWGFMRMIDIMRLFIRDDKLNRWRYFWELSE